MTIPIVVICDSKNILSVAVTIFSLLNTQKVGVSYKVYVLGYALSYKQIDFLKKVTSQLAPLKFIDCSSINLKHINRWENIQQFSSTSSILKFYIPEVVRETKVICLCEDSVVINDLSKVYKEDISGVYAITCQAPENINREHGSIVNFLDSSIVLLNLTLLRQDKIFSNLFNFKLKNPNITRTDFDELNSVIKDKTKPFPHQYCFFSTDACQHNKYLRNINLKANYFKCHQLETKTAVIHYLSKEKMWENPDIPFLSLWFNFARKLPRIAPIAITLTSYPARIKKVNEVIHSLLQQTLTPNKIILWLAESQFPGGFRSLPQQLTSIVSDTFEIRWTDDLRSFKKLLPSLTEFKDYILVTADDDILYPKTWLEKLYLSYLANVNDRIVWCHRAHVIETTVRSVLPYSRWPKCIYYADSPSFRLFCTTGGGVLYPPNCFSNEVFNPKYASITPTCDDIWFHAMLVLNNYKVGLVPKPFVQIEVIESTQSETLFQKNNAEGGNDACLEKLFLEYPEIKFKIIKTPKPKYQYDKSLVNSAIRKFLFSTRHFLKRLLFVFFPVSKKR
ncbi:glycosyltransferase [Parasutterella secunda]|uniref:glycosyltransferase n=1 Tax=Parasutterella secunda TaxID=626947 RepID=UPI0025A38EEB|nr:glycosyltransferase [Parasutterella secunda]MDM8226304.1 glycosyltransferase [Parasutterella secunda]